MNTFKAEINKIILALTTVGIVILLMFPVSLSADHFRYGTMSWSLVSDNGTHITIRLKMENGWTADHDDFDTASSVSYSGLWVSGYVGSIKNNYQTIYWGDGTDGTPVDFRIKSRNTTTNNTISEMGEYASSVWTTGVTHTYPDNGTTEYVVYWARIAESLLKMIMVIIGGTKQRSI